MRAAICLPLIALLAVSVIAQEAIKDKDESVAATKRAVLAREEEYQQAFKKGDWDAIAAIWDDDLVYVSELGESRSKPELLANLKGGTVAASAPGSVAAAAQTKQLPGQDWSNKQHFYKLDHTQLEVHVFGDTAVLTAYSTSRINDRGRWTTGPRRLTRVWSRQPDGTWDQVVRIPTLIVK
jgi:ketosteroid isomerase-like protein